MRINYSNSLLKLFFSYFVFILLVFILAKDTNRTSSYIITVISAVIALLFLSYNSAKIFGFNILWIALLGLFFKLFIGYLFWQFYIFPDYFTSETSQFKFNHFEYLLTFHWMQQLAEYRIQYGIFTFPVERLFEKHIFLHYIMSNLFLSGSFNPLDISVQNSFISILTAYLILKIGKFYAIERVKLKWIFLVVVFQPFSIISSIIWRDVTGQFFIALGGFLLVLANHKQSKNIILLVFFASLSMFLQRFIYLIFPVLAYTGVLFLKRNNKRILFVLPIVLVSIVYINDFFLLSDKLVNSYGQNINSGNLWLFLPINLMRIFIGPFPWSNWFRFSDETIFLIGDYFQAVVNIVLFFSVFKIVQFLKPATFFKGRFGLLFILFGLFLFTSLGTTGIHLSYFSTGVIFLVPIVASFDLFRKKVFRLFVFVFLFFIFLNLMLVPLGLTGLGILSGFR